MNDYLMIIKTEGSIWTDLKKSDLQEHIENGGVYIKNLLEKGILKNANPIEKNGSKILTEKNGKFNIADYNHENPLVAGFFHITTKDIDEAIEIAKANPIFRDISTKIEIYPLMPIGGR